MNADFRIQWLHKKLCENCYPNAMRLAEKYVRAVEQTFVKTGKLFEKYNLLEGSADAVSEYGTPEMMGWTAGVYLTLKHFLEERAGK